MVMGEFQWGRENPNSFCLERITINKGSNAFSYKIKRRGRLNLGTRY